MNAPTVISSAAAMLAVAAFPASAAVSNSKALALLAPTSAVVEKVDFAQGHETIVGVAARGAASRAELSSAMTQRYFDADIIITLGALALASGAFVAVGIAGGRRRAATGSAVSPREGWREEVMQALEEDLAQFTVGLRRAA